MVLNLSVDDADARARFDVAVEALLDEPGSAPRLIVSLDGDALPADLVATMVGGLRRLREVGGAVAVDPRSAAIRDAMALHGLDRVFALPIDPESGKRTRRGTWVAANGNRLRVALGVRCECVAGEGRRTIGSCGCRARCGHDSRARHRT